MLHTSPYFFYSDCGALAVGLSIDVGASVSFGTAVVVGVCVGGIVTTFGAGLCISAASFSMDC